MIEIEFKKVKKKNREVGKNSQSQDYISKQLPNQGNRWTAWEAFQFPKSRKEFHSSGPDKLCVSILKKNILIFFIIIGKFEGMNFRNYFII